MFLVTRAVIAGGCSGGGADGGGSNEFDKTKAINVT